MQLKISEPPLLIVIKICNCSVILVYVMLACNLVMFKSLTLLHIGPINCLIYVSAFFFFFYTLCFRGKSRISQGALATRGIHSGGLVSDKWLLKLYHMQCIKHVCSMQSILNL